MSASSCAACGFANPAGALFCGNCGSPLGGRPLSTVVPPELPSAPQERRSRRTSPFRAPKSGKCLGRLVDPSALRAAQSCSILRIGGLQTLLRPRAEGDPELRRNGRVVHRRCGRRFGAPAHATTRRAPCCRACSPRRQGYERGRPEPRAAHRVAVTTGEAPSASDARRSRAKVSQRVTSWLQPALQSAAGRRDLVDDATRRASEHPAGTRGSPQSSKGGAGAAEAVIRTRARRRHCPRRRPRSSGETPSSQRSAMRLRARYAPAPHSWSHSSAFPESARADWCGSSTRRCTRTRASSLPGARVARFPTARESHTGRSAR
jgi:hypothetical protein